MKKQNPEQMLRELAKAHGIVLSFDSTLGGTVFATNEALIAVLKALGVRLKDDLSNVEALCKSQRLRQLKQIIPEINVVWKGSPQVLTLTIPKKLSSSKAHLSIFLEGGSTRELHFGFSKLKTHKLQVFGKDYYLEKRLCLNESLSIGYHSYILEIGKQVHKGFIISAPSHAYEHPKLKKGSKTLGLFAPVYSLHSNRSAGIGDLEDLSQLLSWAKTNGAEFVGTLPLLSQFLEKPLFEPCPYSAATKLFWNEIFIALEKTDEFLNCPDARQSLEKLLAQRTKRYLDYEEIYKKKRKILESLSREFFRNDKHLSKDFRSFLKDKPYVRDYALFRAYGEKTKKPWQKFPHKERSGSISERCVSKESFEFHLYVQWVLAQQLSALSSQGGGSLGIYLDLPLSVNASGFDVWREPGCFASDVEAGCPPENAFAEGQEWGIAPLHPVGMRKDCYRYFRACIENQMRYTGMLRIDHVMQLYRLYWVPRGLGAKNGAYVLYPCEELFAILCLESQRNKCVLIGEDLGTVPPEIRKHMRKHRVLGMYVQVYSIRNDPKNPIQKPLENQVASFGTHDMPTFAGYWNAQDIKDKKALGRLTKDEFIQKCRYREACKRQGLRYLKKKGFLKKGAHTLNDYFEAFSKLLAKEDARVMVLNLEDIWLEKLPQNIPATSTERPNWRRTFTYSLERIFASEACRRLPQQLTLLRK